MSLDRATLASDNTVYAQLIIDLGPEEVCETPRCSASRPSSTAIPAEGLGGLHARVSPLEMAERLRDAGPGGVRHRPTRSRRSCSPTARARTSASSKGKRVISDGLAYEVTKILEKNVQGGTGTAANYGCPAAGKTGTTDEAKDAWFVGYTPELAAAVWVGYPDAGIAMPGAQGGTYAAPVWHAFMEIATATTATTSRSPPSRPSSTPFFGKYAQHWRAITATTTTAAPTPRPTRGRHRRRRTPARRPRHYEAPRRRTTPERPGAARAAPPASAAAGGTARDPPSRPGAVAELDLIARDPGGARRPRGERVVRWTGDDAAVVRARPLAVTSIDTVADGVHFALATHSPADVGWKALATALSDLAAMGADPGEAYVSLVAPGGLRRRARARSARWRSWPSARG